MGLLLEEDNVVSTGHSPLLTLYEITMTGQA